MGGEEDRLRGGRGRHFFTEATHCVFGPGWWQTRRGQRLTRGGGRCLCRAGDGVYADVESIVCAEEVSGISVEVERRLWEVSSVSVVWFCGGRIKRETAFLWWPKELQTGG